MRKNLMLIPIVPLTILALAGCGAQKEEIPVVEPAESTIEASTQEKASVLDFDPFEKITMVYEGLDTIGTCYYELEDAEIFAATGTKVVPDKVAGLSNGDTVTVHVIYADGTDVTKDYTVSGLEELPSEDEASYADSVLDQMPDGLLFKHNLELAKDLSEAADSAEITEEDPGDAEAVQAEVEAGIVPAVDTNGVYIELSNGLMVTPNIKLLKSDLKDNAKFVLAGLPEGDYWVVDFCSPMEYHIADDPQPDWAFSGQAKAGDKVDLTWSASTCDDYSNLYIAVRPVAGGDVIEYNFPLQ